MFCEKDDPAGVLEVEGGNPLDKIGTIERYFDSEKFRTLRFAILLVYSYEPRGRGREWRYPATETAPIVDAMRELTVRHSARSAILVTLDKAYHHFTEGLRSATTYYSGTTSAIHGILFAGGREMGRVKYL
jgi:hypothetical protein